MNYRRIFADGYSYFITMVTHNRNPLLIDNIEGLRNAFVWSKKKYEYHIDAIVILPDHLHMIITPKNSLEYPKIISHIKRSFLYGLDKAIKEEAKMTLSASKYKRQHSGIWQDRYYEHTIRDEKDWLKTMKYIENNPIKHNLVKDTKDWKYSSFYKKS
jgi:putative transposase